MVYTGGLLICKPLMPIKLAIVLIVGLQLITASLKICPNFYSFLVFSFILFILNTIYLNCYFKLINFN